MTLPKNENIIARENLKEVLARQGNQMFRATFVKQNGRTRDMVARHGVKNHLRGGVNTTESSDRPYVTLFDMHTKDYRNINLHTMKEVKIRGCVFEIK